MQKDNFTDVVENLPNEQDNSQNYQDNIQNQQVISSDGDIVTLGQDSENN
jgi:hypothetical protein